MKKVLIFSILFACVLGLFGLANFSQAASVEATVVKLENPIEGGEIGFDILIGRVIQTALGILGSLALLMFVIGGVTWLVAFGNPERIKSGTKTMLWSGIGVLVIMSSYAILSLILNTGLGLINASPDFENEGGTEVSTPEEEIPKLEIPKPEAICASESANCYYKVKSSRISVYEQKGADKAGNPIFTSTGIKILSNKKNVCVQVENELTDAQKNKFLVTDLKTTKISPVVFKATVGSTVYWQKIDDPTKANDLCKAGMAADLEKVLLK